MDPVTQLNSALTGRYEIEREIGAGGMATVYLARDIKHDRRVALKLLNPELGAVLGVERFLSEIKVTANLQHPNLLPLFDSGAADGLLFYVMPFVDGETLRARITRERQLPVDEAVRIGVAVAGALDYAHAHGVIHRDLKPENILLQHGQPVVADFGIALAVSNAGGQRVTQTGLSLGTPQYMSPEQATGDRVIDGRTDIYSLGCVLYEMLTGDPPHTASTAQAIVAKVLMDRPRPVRSSRPSVPEHMEFAIDHALEKLPADRFATAREFAEALQGRSTIRLTSAAKRSGATTRSRLGDPLLIGALLLAVAGIASAAVLWSRTRAALPVAPIRFTVTPQSGVHVVDAATWAVTLSPDGRSVVFTGQEKTEPYRLYVRALDQLVARPIPGTEHATEPVFSPDGKWIVFRADGKLKKLSFDGGAPATLADMQSENGLAWSVGDVIVMGADGARHGLARVPASGGAPVELTRVDSSKHELEHLWPIVLDDGKTVVFTVYYGSLRTARLAVTSLDDGKVTLLDATGIVPLGVFANHLVYVRSDGVVVAAPFDVKHRRVTGAAVPAFDAVSVCGGCNGDAKVRIAANGSAVYMTGSIAARLEWVAPDGKETPVLDDVRSFVYPRVSPNGKQIAVGIVGAQGTDIWAYDIASATLSRVTSGANSGVGEWTSDGKRVVFYSEQDGGGIFSQLVDGNGHAEKLFDAKFLVGQGTLSPDGRTLLYMTVTNANIDVMTASLSGDKTPHPFVATDASERAPRFSPDGRYVAYESNRSGQSEVYVRTFPDSSGRVQVSASGGIEPVWARDGSRLFYRNGGRMLAADLTTLPALAVKSRTPLFEGAYYQDGTIASYDVSGGANPRFLMLKSNDTNLQIVVVTNWVEELKRHIAKR